MSKKLKILLVCTTCMACYTPITQAKIVKMDAYGILIYPGLTVIDGDTIHLKSNGITHRVRLMGIDAPERDQRFGVDSTYTLVDCLRYAKKIKIEWAKKDKYGRLLGKVIADDRDCNLQQVKKGYAWHYKFYQDEQSFIDRYVYSSAERISQKLKRGLWLDEYPIAPWDWRRHKY